MKKICSLLLFVFPLLLMVSCNMEKRLYRNGWYIEKNHPAVVSQEQNFLPDSNIAKTTQQSETKLPADSAHAVVPVTENTPAVLRVSQKIQNLRKLRKELKDGDPLVKMTYAQARASMAKKGCQPDKLALTVYFMSLASIAGLLIGIGFLSAIISLIISIFAAEKVMAAGGDCMEENLAIIKAGRRISWGVIAGMIILSAIIFFSILALVVWANQL